MSSANSQARGYGPRRSPGRRSRSIIPSNMPLPPAARCARVMPRTSAQEGAARPSTEGAGDPQDKGAGNAGCPVHPQPRARMVVVDAHGYSPRGHRNRPAFPHAMVLTAYSVLSPATIRLATVIGGFRFCPARLSPTRLRRLDASIGRQDHTTSPSASRLRQRPGGSAHPPRLSEAEAAPFVYAAGASLTGSNPPCVPLARRRCPRPPHPIPTSVTIAIRPLCPKNLPE